MNRKWIAILLSCAMLLLLAAACGNRNNNDDNANNGTNNGATDGMGDNNTGNGNTNVNDPNNLSPNNGLNGSEGNGSAPEANNAPGMNDTNPGNYPTFPNSLATVDADVAVDDLIATLGLTETDLETAMKDIATVGDGVDGARTYRHKLLGHEADVSYGFDDNRAINKVTVKTQKEHADTWRQELNDVLGAKAVEGQTDTWDYSDSSVKMTEDGEHFIITIEKPQN